ncbi:Pro-Pol polyprotein, partial [Cyphomyrmex costatus]
ILVLVDAFTRFTWLFSVKTTNSRETIVNLLTVFDTFGNPRLLVSDRGTAFSSSEFADFMRERHVDHRMVAVASPWANGNVERINRFLKLSLRKMIEEQTSWASKINELQYIINNTYNSSIKTTPSKLLLGYDMRNHSDSKLTQFLKNLYNETMDLSDSRNQIRDIALQASNRVKDYNKAYYDKRHKHPTKYSLGDMVMIKSTAIKFGEDRKLHLPYRGPYRIAKVLDNDRYVVQDIPGCQITQKPYNGILTSDKLKPWIMIPRE